MLTRIWRRFGLAIMLCLVLWPLLAVDADTETWVRVRPAGGSFPRGQAIEVEVWIEHVQDLYAADVQLSFDVQHLAVVDADPTTTAIDVTPRDDLLSPDWILRKVADNQAGTVWYAVSQLNPSEAVSGSGALFSFSFRTLSPGPAEVSVHYRKLVRRDGSEIPAEAAGAAYQIVEAPHRVFLPLVSRGLFTGMAAGSVAE